MNDDGAPPALSVGDGSGTEGGAAGLTVTLAPANATQTVTVNWATTSGSATGNVDYTTASGTLTFNPGVTTQPIPLTLLQDTLDEPNETFTVTLSGAVNATIADGTAIATIVDDDPTPTLSINDVTLLEGNGGTTNFVFTVSLSAASGQAITVNATTVAGTAVAPNDYTTSTGTLPFAPGVVTATLTVPVVADTVTEPTETFTVVLSAPTNATIADGTGVGTITNDDSGVGPTTVTLQIAAGDDDVNEAATVLSPSGASVWLGNASGASYTGLRFTGAGLPAGATITSARLEVNAANTQWMAMAFEFGIEAALNSQAFAAGSLPSQRTLLAPRVMHASDAQWVAGTWYALDDIAPLVQGLVNQPGWNSGNALSLILRGTGNTWARKFARAFDDTPALASRLVVTYIPSGLPSLSVNDVSVTEGTGGTQSAVFTVSLSASSTSTVTVNAATANGTATAPGDYTALAGTPVSFAPGVLTQTVSVPLVTDATSEVNETFSLVLSSPTNATIGDATGVATIVNDDGAPPALSVGDGSATEGGPLALTVTLAPANATQTVTVNWATTSGSAAGNVDYTTASGTLTFNPGVTSQPIPLTLLQDTLDEPNETFTVSLNTPVNAPIADGTAVATIVDDDPTPTLSINDVTLLEGNGGTTNFVFTVSLSAASGQAISVNATTVAGTAVAPNDYTTATGTLPFAPGVVTATLTVPVVADTVTEPTETFTVVLSAPTNATIADGTGVGTIANDDSGVGPTTVTLQIAAGNDDVNEAATVLSPSGASVWLGNASGASYTGLRFTGAGLPAGATITSARLEVNAANTQWIGMAFEFGIEAALNSQAFAAGSLPSQRTLLAPRVMHASDAQWVAGTWYALDDIAPLVQGLVNQPGWNSGNALSLILRGTGNTWSRKFARAFDDTPALAPRLVVTYVTP